MASNVTNLALFMFSEYNKLQTLDDAFWSFNPGNLDAEAARYYDEHKDFARKFGSEIDHLKSLNAEQVGELGADIFVDILRDCLTLKCFGLIIKGANWTILQGVDKFTDAIKTEIEFARSSALPSTIEDSFKIGPTITNITLNHGYEVAGIVGEIIAEDASLLAAGKDFDAILKDVVEIEKKIDTLINKGAKLRKVKFLRGFEHAKDKHFHILKDKEAFSLRLLDPNGNYGKWVQYFIDLALKGKGVSKKIPTGEVLDIIENMPKTDGTGTIEAGVRLFKKNGTDLWILDTVLTKQPTIK